MAHGRMHALNVSSPVHEHIFALMTRGRSARDRLDSLASGAALDEEPLFARSSMLQRPTRNPGGLTSS